MLALMHGGYLPMSVIHNSLFDGLNLFPLLAIPCFVIAGTIMEHGRITEEIVGVVKQLVGRMHGGLGLTSILACTFFAAISGSGPGTVAAVGTLMVPAMVRAGYSREYAGSVVSSGGTIRITSYNVCYTKLLRALGLMAAKSKPTAGKCAVR